MHPTYFKAILKTVDDKLLEEGYACVFRQENAVEFKNEFVPLLKMGETVKIYRVMDGEETHEFIGQVYLSSRNLLRIVSVQDRVLSQLENIAMVDADFPALFLPLTGQEAPKPPFRKEDILHGTIFAINLDSLKFTSGHVLLEGQKLLVQTGEPLELKKCVVEIIKLISFGGTNAYRCAIRSLPQICKDAVLDYMESQNTIFKDQVVQKIVSEPDFIGGISPSKDTMPGRR